MTYQERCRDGCTLWRFGNTVIHFATLPRVNDPFNRLRFDKATPEKRYRPTHIVFPVSAAIRAVNPNLELF
jgi:hypothetical protein